jgi:hypothetical protein
MHPSEEEGWCPKGMDICLGQPEYDSPMHQEKATREKMFDYQVFDPSSPKDKSLA